MQEGEINVQSVFLGCLMYLFPLLPTSLISSGKECRIPKAAA